VPSTKTADPAKAKGSLSNPFFRACANPLNNSRGSEIGRTAIRVTLELIFERDVFGIVLLEPFFGGVYIHKHLKMVSTADLFA
jgi:hypothetical protein